VLRRSPSRWPQSYALRPLDHARFSKCGLSVIGGVLQKVPDGLSRPDRLAGFGPLTRLLESAANFAQAAAMHANPLENLFDQLRLIWNGLESSLTAARMDAGVSISEGRAENHD